MQYVDIQSTNTASMGLTVAYTGLGIACLLFFCRVSQVKG